MRALIIIRAFLLIRNSVQLLLAVLRQVSTLGQVLANQAVDVLVAATLPRCHGQGVDGVVDRFTANVGFFKIDFHNAQLARDLLGRKTLSKQVDNQFEPFIARPPFSGRTTDFSTLTSKGLGFARRIASSGKGISSQLAADRGRTMPPADEQSFAD